MLRAAAGSAGKIFCAIAVKCGREEIEVAPALRAGEKSHSAGPSMR